MSEISNYLRLMINGDKELKVTNVRATGVAALFTSQLSSGYKRKAFSVYNNSIAASGECYWGGSDATPNNASMPIPKGAFFELPVTTDLNVYFVADSGEIGDLRIIEIA